MTVNSGTWLLYSSWVSGVMNMLRANRDCQASSVMMRIGMRYSGSAPAIAVLDEDLFVLQEGLHAGEQGVELLGVVGAVVLAPPDLVFGRVLAHDVLVLRGAR